MAHISNFNKFKLMLESNDVNYYNLLLEKINSTGLTKAVAIGAELEDIDRSGNSFSNETQPALAKTARNTFGKTTIPELRVNNIASVGSSDELGTMLIDFLAGIAAKTGNEDLNKADAAEDMVNGLNIKTIRLEKSVQAIRPKDRGIEMVQSVGAVRRNEILKPGETHRSSNVDLICRYVNGFNIQNWQAGDFTQYDPYKMLNDLKRIDLTSGSGSTIKESGFLYLITPSKIEKTAGGREEKDIIIQGKSAQEGSVANAFDTMKYQSTATSPWVKEIGDKIKGYLGDTGRIKKITLTSSASPDWYKQQTSGNGVGDPSKGKLKPETFAKEQSALGNQYLAWLRGESFKQALQQYLGAAYPEEAGNTVINWKISTDEPGAGKHFKYKIEIKEEAPEVITKTEFQAGTDTVTQGTSEFYVYKVSYDAAGTGKDSKGILGIGGKTSYENLKVGDKIKILTKQMNKAKGEYTISKIEDNLVYIDVKGEDREIPKNRYVKRVSTTEEVDEI